METKTTQTTSTTSSPNSQFSLEKLYEKLGKYIENYEKDLNESIEKMGGEGTKDIDQSTLLRMQARVQTWGTIVTAATGTVRAIGDGLKSTAQNIR